MLINRTAPFLGKGITWPFRINPATGGFQMSEGTFDDIPVKLAFTPDATTVRDTPPVGPNKLQEAISHILSTQIGEYDWLPPFGSKTNAVIHDPNDDYSKIEYETWVELATARWEKRVQMKAPENFEWANNEDLIDQNTARCRIDPAIIPNQTQGNLVAPFVSARDCRNQEFPIGDMDSEGHDWASRYHGQSGFEINGERFLRSRRVPPINFQADDQFYTVEQGDTWYSISYKLYGDVRFWWAIADMYVNDAANAGMSRKALKVTEELVTGTMLRAPSKGRILTQMAA